MNVKHQEEAQRCLLRIIGAVQVLARQGSPFRGHDWTEEYCEQVLKYKSEDDSCLTKRLPGGKKDLYTSAVAQDKIVSLFSSVIVRKIVENIRLFPHLQLSAMVKGKRDVSIRDQKAACLNHVS